MEIRPMKDTKLPRYAAAIVAVAAAGLMTGCQTSGEVATEGVAPQPLTEEIALAGEEVSITDDSELIEPTDETQCGTGCTEPLPDDSEVALAGEVEPTDDEDLRLEGGAPLEDSSYYTDVELDGYIAVESDPADFGFENTAQIAKMLSRTIISGFAQRDLPLELDDSDTEYYMPCVYRGKVDTNLRFCFFDGSVTSGNTTCRDYVNDLLAPLDTEYDWGYMKEIYDVSEDFTYYVVYIDLSRCGGLSEDAFAAIAEDIVG